MMSITEALIRARLQERDALALVRAVITSHAGADAAWCYVVAALDARLLRLEAWLRREDATLVRECEQMLGGERAPQELGPGPSLISAALPRGARVH